MEEEKTESTYKVPLTKIVQIKKHENADSLEIVIVYGFEIITRKGYYKVGDEVIYIPIDSILPPELENHIFHPDSKVKLKKHRVRQIKLRGTYSQGLLVSKEDIQAVYGFTPDELERDYKEVFRIVKYEPPAPRFQSNMNNGQNKRNKPLENANFHKYNGLDNIKWYPNLFKEEDQVIFQEKIHGTNARAGIMPFQANTFWKKIKKLFRLTPKYEFCYGSNNVQLQERRGYVGFYGEDVYGKVFKDLKVDSKLNPGEAIYGEIYGGGIQKNYNYGCGPEEQKFILFDVKKIKPDGSQRWLNPDEVKEFAKERGFDMVPELYRGPFNIELAKELTKGNSMLAPSQKVREGLVVKALTDYTDDRGNKKALKVISEKYLSKDQTEFH